MSVGFGTMSNAKIGQVIVESVKSDFQVAKDALDGAKVAEDLAVSETDPAKRQQLEDLKERFLKISDTASTNATTTSSIGPYLAR